VTRQPDFDSIVVGGGFFGCILALHLRRDLGQRVALFEMGPGLLERASFANQARVHNGYHYPRSLLTALRCRVNFPRFVADYAACLDDEFESYYAVARTFSKVTAAQYRQFCERIGAPTERAPGHIRKLFDPELVEEVFSVQERAFDAVRLRNAVAADVERFAVDVRLNHEVRSAKRSPGGGLEVTVVASGSSQEERFLAPSVYNCTYARINALLVGSGLAPIHLKHELAEMPLVEIPDEIKGRAFTMMCGPFFSIMPFPSRGLHTLSHVRYTPHTEWADAPGGSWRDPYAMLAASPRRSNFPHMIRDIRRYMPGLRACRQVDSLWEVKTVLPQCEVDDSRPVLFRRDAGLPGLTCLLGAKIDNIYDVLEVMDSAVAAPGPIAHASFGI
jgi:glycine/D-amino acid oxidase-like deaminating enzyme